MLNISNLVKKFKDHLAVDDITFTVKENKIFGLLGPNGAGKTTTIRMILNIIKPTSGDISFNGYTINKKIQNLIGYLPEDRGLYKKSKVIDVIRYFGELKSLTRNQAYESGKKWLKRLEIEHYTNKRIEELSKGNQQKIQFITAVLHDPQIIILDEPFSGFDPLNQEMISDIISEFINTGKLIIISTHLMEIAEKLCSEIVVLNKGKTVLSGDINEIKKEFGRNKFSLEFEGNPELLKQISSIKEFKVKKNIAEVSLYESIKPSEFLKSVVEKLEVQRFTYLHPTLNNIFLETIRFINGNGHK